MFLLQVKVLSGPFIGLFVNIIYCDSFTPYHIGNICYEPSHIMYCFVAVGLALAVIVQNGVYIFFYFDKNPLSESSLGFPNRNYMISKSALKLALPIYFAINGKLKLEFLYISLIPGVWGAYLFYHRFFSLHSFKQTFFYVEYFLEIFLFWMATCGLLSHHIDQSPNPT